MNGTDGTSEDKVKVGQQAEEQGLIDSYIKLADTGKCLGTGTMQKESVVLDSEMEATNIPPRTKPTGIKGGKPTGKRTKIYSEDDKVTQRSHELENDSADVLAHAGYKIEKNPTVPGNKNPDYIIEGKVFDNKAPNGSKPRNAASEIEKAVREEQADHIILNLEDAKFTPEHMKKQLDKWPIKGLKEVIVIKDG